MTLLRPTGPAPLLALLLSTALPVGVANAAEVDFTGFYRARAQAFDSLSLDRGADLNEGLAAYVQHRFWLRPRFILSENVALMADIRGLSDVPWGVEPDVFFDPTLQGLPPLVFTDGLVEPSIDTTSGDAKAARGGLNLWRAWGEVHTDIGRFDFGRVPLHWGLGIWQNDGVTNQDFLTDAVGDSSDRVQWEHLFGDVYVQAAVGMRSEGFINFTGDDIVDYEASAAWRSERLVTGLRGQLRRVGGGDFNLFTISATANAELGRLELGAEAVGRFGGGDLGGGLNDIGVSAGGGVLEATIGTSAIDLGLIAGIATGDGDRGDDSLHDFVFDRNYSIALIMFEQPMPVLAAATPNVTNAGRDLSLVQSGQAISNAIFLKPRIARDLIEDELTVELAAIGARAMVSPGTEGRMTYGLEFDAGVTYRGIEHVELGATFAVFLPGDFYSDLDAGDFDFGDPVLGGLLGARIEF